MLPKMSGINSNAAVRVYMYNNILYCTYLLLRVYIMAEAQNGLRFLNIECGGRLMPSWRRIS